MKEVLHHREESAHLEGLLEKAVGAADDAERAVSDVRDEDEGDLVERVLLADGLEHLEPVDAALREADVADDEVGPELLERDQRGLAATGRHDAVPGLLHRGGDLLAKARVVVNDEDVGHESIILRSLV